MTYVDPDAAQDSAEYVLLLRRRREAAGLSYRQLARQARQGARSLPPSTVATMLHRSTLPSRDLVTTYIRACGGTDAEVAAWLETRTRIAMSAGTRHQRPPGGAKIHGASTATISAEPVLPRQLPPAVANLVGRRHQIVEMDTAITGPGPGLIIVSGAPGVGKTALAVQWAHRVSRRFPDGQFHLDLRGHGQCAAVPTRAALVQLLVALGVPAGRVPTDERQAASLFRSVVAGRRVLLLLDGAVSAEQVRLLRPGGPGTCTVVTSRDSLVGLAVHDGGRMIEVPPLEQPHAVQLLSQTVGERAVAAEPEAAGVLTELCDRLPLALRIAAIGLGPGTRTPLADLVARMRANGRLTALAVHGDPEAGLEASFAPSYHRLDNASKRVFRLLGTLPTAVVTASVAAAALAETVGYVQTALCRLVDGHLVTRLGVDSYWMPDLLREYAGQLAVGSDPFLGHRRSGRGEPSRRMFVVEGMGRRSPAS
ncbi:NB-ARC domain-containing protein [Plantactinospora sp. B6F1]